MFKGKGVSLFTIIGPDMGKIKLTIDGKDYGVKEKVSKSCCCKWISALPIASGLEDTVHTVTIELLPEPPDRTVAIDEAKRLNKYKSEDFDGVALYIGWIRIVEN